MKCPNCSHEVRQNQFRCPSCGWELPDTWWPANPNLFQGPTSHARSASARSIYLYLTATRELVKRYSLWKIFLVIAAFIGLTVAVGYFTLKSVLSRHDRSVEALIIELKDSDSEKRLKAAKALCEIRAPQSVEPLITALKDEDPRLRAEAARALGKMHDRRATQPLITALEDTNPVVRRKAARALMEKGDPRSVQPFIHALQDEDSEIRRIAAAALGRIKDVSAIAPLIGALKDENLRVRREAVRALGQIRDISTVEPLVALLKDEDRRLRAEAARALGPIGDARAVEPLISALKDEDFRVRRNAAQALGWIRDLRAVGPLISALNDKDERLRHCAVGSLQYMTGKHFGQASKQWQEWWEENKAVFGRSTTGSADEVKKPNSVHGYIEQTSKLWGISEVIINEDGSVTLFDSKTTEPGYGLSLRNSDKKSVDQVTLKPKEVCSLTDHHACITYRFLTVDGSKIAFSVSDKFDARSFGGGIKEDTKILSVKPYEKK